MKYPNITFGRVEAVWNKLGGEEGVQRFLARHSEVFSKEHIIDCDADPLMPNGWKVEEHHKGGLFKFDASQINLYLSAAQKNGSIKGNEFRKELAGKPVLNANVLDYLLAHPELIPEEWKGKYVFFWGTIYRRFGHDLYVRCLCEDGGGWGWSDYWLGHDWRVNYPAAVACKLNLGL